MKTIGSLILRDVSPDELLEFIEANPESVTTNNSCGTPLFMALVMGRIKLAKALIKHGAPTTGEIQCTTYLHCAAKCGDLEILRQVLANTGNLINSKNDLGFTPLQLAARNNATEAVRLLIEHGAVSSPDPEGFLPEESLISRQMTHHVRNEELTELAELVKSNFRLADKIINIKGSYESPVFVACTENKASALNVFLQAGISPNAEFSPWKCPLLSACAARGCCDTIKALLAANADINRPGHDDETPLMAAIRNQAFSAAKLLLQRGADATKTTNEGKTTFHELFEYTQKIPRSVVALLLKAGADPHAKDSSGKAAWDMAGEKQRQLVKEIKQETEIVE